MTYIIPVFSHEQENILDKLHKIGIITRTYDGDSHYDDAITEYTVIALIAVKTNYIFAKFLTALFARGVFGGETAKITLERLDRLSENDEEFREMLRILRSFNPEHVVKHDEGTEVTFGDDV